MNHPRLFTLCFLFTAVVLSGQAISPWLVGTNHWFQLEGVKAESLAPGLKQSGMQVVRIGGNGYNKTWPGDARVGRWVDYVRSVGAEPILQISALQGPEQAAATVRFFNDAKRAPGRRPIMLWSIGNEPDLDKWPTQRVHDYVLALAAAMKAVDPSIQIFVPDLAGPHFEHLDRLIGGDLDVTGAKLGDVFLVDGISWHRYAFWKDYTREEAMTRIEPAFHQPIRRLRALMAKADTLHGRVGSRRLKWALGEFNINVSINTSADPARYQAVEGIGVHSFFNGQFFAELYGVCMAEEAFFATSWSIHESNGDRGTTDFGLFDGPATALSPRSSFHHTAMVARNFRGEYVPVVHAVENLVAYAASAEGGVTVMLLNKDTTRTRELRLYFDGRPRAGAGKLVLRGSGPAKRVGARRETVPAQTSMVLAYDATGALRKRVVYSLGHAQKNLPPDEQVFPERTFGGSGPLGRRGRR